MASLDWKTWISEVRSASFDQNIFSNCVGLDEQNNSMIPGMGPEDKVEITALIGDENTTIPGLDLDSGLLVNEERAKPKKVPFSKPIPRNFQAQWNEASSVGKFERLCFSDFFT